MKIHWWLTPKNQWPPKQQNKNSKEKSRSMLYSILQTRFPRFSFFFFFFSESSCSKNTISHWELWYHVVNSLGIFLHEMIIKRECIACSQIDMWLWTNYFMSLAFVFYNCTTNYHKLSSLGKHIYYLTVSVSQESGSDNQGFWLRVSNKVAIKMAARTAFTWRLDWGWTSHVQGDILTWLLPRGLSFSLAAGWWPWFLTTWAFP